MTDSPSTSPSAPERRCPVCGARVAQRATQCLMCGTDLEAARPALSLIVPRRRLPWVPLIFGAALLGVLLAGGGLFVAGRLNTPSGATPLAAVTGASVTPAGTPAGTPARSATPRPSATATLAATSTDTATPVPTPTLPAPIRYTIQPGDTLLDLAQRFNVSVDAIMAANNLTDTTLVAGQELVIPQPTPAAPDEPGGTPATPTAEVLTAEHVVEAGETLSEIAEQYGVSVEAIQDLNGISDPESIKPGDKLLIPLGTATPPPSPTPGPTATATARPQYEAPVLLSPADNAAFVSQPQPGQFPAGGPIVLQWTSAGLLGTSPPDPANEWYRVTLRNVSTGTGPLYYYTRTTSWRLPPELRDGLAPRLYTFSWEVDVVRETGRSADGTLQVVANGRASRLRTFQWEVLSGSPTPAP